MYGCHRHLPAAAVLVWGTGLRMMAVPNCHVESWPTVVSASAEQLQWCSAVCVTVTLVLVWTGLCSAAAAAVAVRYAGLLLTVLPSSTCSSWNALSAASCSLNVTKPNPRGLFVTLSRITICKRTAVGRCWNEVGQGWGCWGTDCMFQTSIAAAVGLLRWDLPLRSALHIC